MVLKAKALQNKKKWTKASIISQLRKIKKKEGKINARHLYLHHGSLYAAISRYFGDGNCQRGWYEAVKAAGFKPEAMRCLKRWTKSSIISELKRIKREEGRINPGYMYEHHSSLYGAIGRQFGGGNLKKGWDAAVRAAGFKPEDTHLSRRWTKKNIISELKKIKKEEGRINPLYLFKNHPDLYGAITRHFGYGSFEEGWYAAVKAAGFNPEALRRRKWTKEAIISELKRIKEKDGRINPSYLSKNYGSLYLAILKYFGKK
jgi:hypothetical protein